MGRTWLGLCAVMVLACAPAEAAAQTRIRNGFWAEAARGTGTVRNTCGGCYSVTVAYGSARVFRAGGTLSSRVLLGLELFQLYSAEQVIAPGGTPVDSENGSIAPIVIWYVGRSGFFLKGGAGLVRGTFTVRSGSQVATARRTGSGLTGGGGFDIAIMPWLALTASLDTYVMAIGDVRVSNDVVTDMIATVYQASVGVTIR